MKPLVTSVRAISELATGLSPDAVASSPVLFQFETTGADYLVSAGDSRESQRVILVRTDNTVERYVPDHLSQFSRDVLSRMASFVERARTRPLSLPRGWHQFKHDNLASFFAVPTRDSQSTRWIAEVLPGDRADVVFWRTTTSDGKSKLAEFAQSRPTPTWDLDGEWATAIGAAVAYFAKVRRPDPLEVEVDGIDLAPLPQSPTRGWSYERWLDAISDDQRAFLNAPTDKSIRLRGPAGSGKTLALTLKAVREVRRAREAGERTRVLIATHSWALAAQITSAIDSMGLGYLDELDVFPLLEIAPSLSPGFDIDATGFTLIGEDSYSGKQAQLDQILELIDEFVGDDWVTFRAGVSKALSARLDSQSEDDRKALAWDLLIEFGSVIGAAAIFPGVGSQLRYAQLQRAPWMLPLSMPADLEVVFELYTRYMQNLEARSLMTSDQVLADVLSHLDTHVWNRLRKSQGYDLVFVDEFHLFSPLERQVLHYLTSDVTIYPRVFMAVDPRQSPSEAFIGIASDATRSSSSVSTDYGLGEVTNLELTTVHRFTPQILGLVKHIHHQFPTFDLGEQWHVDLAAVESAQNEGPLPRLISSASCAAEEVDIYRAVRELYPKGRVALAVVDSRQWRRLSDLGSRIDQSEKFHVCSITGRSDIEGLGTRRRGLIVGPVEYLAGLQFENVLVAGIPDLNTGAMVANERTQLLSLLYLAISRAEQEVRVFVNDENGGPPAVLDTAVSNGKMIRERGSLV